MSEIFDIPGLKDLSDGELAVRAENVADHLEEHEAYKETSRPDCIPGPGQIRAQAQEVKWTSQAARLDPGKEPENQAAREKVIQSIRFSCQYLVMYSTHANNPSLLENVGVNKVQKAHRTAGVRVPDKPFHKFKVVHGNKSGSVKINVNSWDGKGSVEVHICYGGPTQEEAWQPLPLSHYYHFTRDGLEPARRAYFRSRLLNDAGIGPWTDTVELIII